MWHLFDSTYLFSTANAPFPGERIATDGHMFIFDFHAVAIHWILSGAVHSTENEFSAA